ncbi:hypothetical protein HN747_00905 [archaeon]|jgi:hypothetical protein|nr:hypothetical protein [archaeon]
MKIHILSGEVAEAFIPGRETYCICIGNSCMNETAVNHLNDLKLCTANVYRFDDTRPNDSCRLEGDIIFNDIMARGIWSDFLDNYRVGDDLLVHCSAGLGRSPAIGLAINKHLRLDWDSQRGILQNAPGFNRWVYKTMLEVAP